MADHTKIEWTEATWNPITGCTVHSPGCTNCYAMQLAGTRLAYHPSRAGLTREVNGNHVWTGEVRFNEEWLTQPLRWKRPRLIFVCAHGDLFHESVPDEWIDRVFAVMALAPHHTFQVLTKRSARMREHLSNQQRAVSIWRAAYEIGKGFGPHTDLRRRLYVLWNESRAALRHPLPLPNIWLGVSVEDQARADQRVPDLLATPAAVRWLSCEPLLGPVDLTMLHHDGITNIDALRGMHGVLQPMLAECEKLDWIVAGGESGADARPMHPDWARSLRDQCQAAGVPFFFKQHGEWIGVDTLTSQQCDDVGDLNRLRADPLTGSVWLGKKAAGRLLDGVEHNGYPDVRHG